MIRCGWTGVVSVVAMSAVGCWWLGARLIPESSPVARGASYAQMRGCADCHATLELAGNESLSARCGDVNERSSHPDYRFPCGDLLAYFESVRLARSAESRFATAKQDGTLTALLKGELLAREYHCFQCHGPLGQGGFANAGALKGYVPGFFGNDFRVLTELGRPEVVRDWITRGVTPGLVDHPVTGRWARYFLERQAVHMPKFATLTDAEIDLLSGYVVALNSFGPMDAAGLREYDRATRSVDHAGGTPNSGVVQR